jgi:hypothetical protein
VDVDALESAKSAAVSPGPAGTDSGGGGGCFISTAENSVKVDGLKAVSIFGIFLIMGIGAFIVRSRV